MAGRRTVLRDYYGGDAVRSTVLADYVGDVYRAGSLRRAMEALVQTNSRLYGLIGGVPAQWRRDWRALRDPLERRMLFRSMRHEALLTQSRRRSLLSIFTWTALLGWLVAGVVVAFAARSHLPTFEAIAALFFYGVATSLFLPVPFETLLTAARSQLGLPVTVLVAGLSKVAGAAMVLMAGDRANEGLELTILRYPRLHKAWLAILHWAQRYGYAAVFVIFAIPFMSDTLPLFLLAVMNMRKGLFLAVTFVAIVIRSLAYLLIGDVIAAWF